MGENAFETRWKTFHNRHCCLESFNSLKLKKTFMIAKNGPNRQKIIHGVWVCVVGVNEEVGQVYRTCLGPPLTLLLHQLQLLLTSNMYLQMIICTYSWVHVHVQIDHHTLCSHEGHYHKLKKTTTMKKIDLHAHLFLSVYSFSCFPSVPFLTLHAQDCWYSPSLLGSRVQVAGTQTSDRGAKKSGRGTKKGKILFHNSSRCSSHSSEKVIKE